jgi:uncharacterized protein involved in exopolysaccharide biosynthesis
MSATAFDKDATMPATFDFTGLAARISRHGWRYVANALLAGALMYGLTYLMPPWYRSTAVILPPEETEDAGVGLSVQRFLSRMPTIGSLSNYYTPADIFHAILVSRTVQQAVAEKFGLMSVYRQKSIEKTVKEFQHHSRIALNPDGTISIAVEDKSRQRAADMANAVVAELDRFNVERRNTQARRTRIFLEQRVAETDSLSKRSEALLKAYSVEHHVVVPVAAPENANAGPLADLMAKKISLEVQLSVLRSYLREGNDRVVQVRTELEQLERQISTLPGVQSELARLVRDVRVYQQAYLLLVAQLEDARLREVMDTPTVTVLDRAVPMERRARPIRWLWAVGAMGLAAIGTLLWLERPLAPSRPRMEPVPLAARD